MCTFSEGWTYSRNLSFCNLLGFVSKPKTYKQILSEFVQKDDPAFTLYKFGNLGNDVEHGTTFPYQEIDISHLNYYAAIWNATRTSIGGTGDLIKMRLEIVASEGEEFRTLNDEIEIIL